LIYNDVRGLICRKEKKVKHKLIKFSVFQPFSSCGTSGTLMRPFAGT
jgi:hypothetical protein